MTYVHTTPQCIQRTNVRARRGDGVTRTFKVQDPRQKTSCYSVTRVGLRRPTRATLPRKASHPAMCANSLRGSAGASPSRSSIPV